MDSVFFKMEFTSHWGLALILAMTVRFSPHTKETVPTFVTAHTFSASRKPWFKDVRAKISTLIFLRLLLLYDDKLVMSEM